MTPRPSRARVPEPIDPLDREEIIAAVCDLFCQGFRAGQIATEMTRRFGARMNREETYTLLRRAAARGWLRYEAPSHSILGDDFGKGFPWLDRVEVVTTRSLDDVAYRAAHVVVEILREMGRKQKTVHIGIAAGNSMRSIARHVASLLQHPSQDLPETLVFHAVVAGLSADAFVTDPSAFFTYFTDPAIQAHLKTRFISLPAPGVVDRELMTRLSEHPEIRDARRQVAYLDLLLTSAGVFGDADGMIQRYYKKYSPRTVNQLEADGCVGDMMWLPVAANRVLETSPYEYRTFALLELQDLPAAIARGLRVALVLGPCSVCGQKKTEVLRAILQMEKRLVTHLVVDSATARDILSASAPGASGPSVSPRRGSRRQGP